MYLRNRSPTTALKGETPFEKLFNRKPDVSNLRVFRCKSFVHIPDHQCKKLQRKSRMCIFMEYLEGTKGFKLYDMSTKEFIRSKNHKNERHERNAIFSSYNVVVRFPRLK